jgi:hypothetical protein
VALPIVILPPTSACFTVSFNTARILSKREFFLFPRPDRHSKYLLHFALIFPVTGKQDPADDLYELGQFSKVSGYGLNGRD